MAQSVPAVHVKVAVGQDKLDQATKSCFCVHLKTGVNGSQETLNKANEVSGGKAAEKQVTVVLEVEGDGAKVATEYEAQVVKTVGAGGQLGGALGMLQSKIQRTVSGSGNKVVLQVTPEESVSQMIEMVVSQAQAMAGQLVEHKNTVDISLKLHNTIGEIVTDQTLPLQKVLEGFSAEICLNILKEFRKQALEMFGDFLPPQFQVAKGPAQLFNNLNVEFNFSSFAELPENLKELTATVGKGFLEKRAMVQGMFQSCAEGEDLALVKFLAANLTGKINVFVVSPVGGLEICLNLPGLSKLLPL